MVNKMKYCLFLTVFVTGAAVLMLELLGTRLISPFYGSSIYVWSSLISVTLVFLALGYFVGGKLTDRRPRLTMLYLFILLAGLSVVLLSLVDSHVLAATDSLGPRWGALCSAFILFSLPMFFLGTITPYAIKVMAKDLKDIGVTSGNLYGVSTVGSFAGAISTGFILIPNFAISTVLNLIALLLFAVVVMGFIGAGKYYGLLFLPLLSVFLLPQLPQPELALAKDIRVLYETESLYGQIKVIDRGARRFLLVNGAVHAEYNLKTKEFTFAYLRLFEKTLKYFPQAKTFLGIGLGGGGIDNKFRAHGIEVDNVEIDPKVIEIAKEYFGFDGEVVTADGRYYVQNSDKKYDLIFLDAFGGYSICPHLVTQESFTSIKNILSPNGILAVNSMGWEFGHSTKDKFVKALYKTLKSVFPHVSVKARGSGFTSMVFYCSNNPLSLDGDFVSVEITPDEETPLFTDNYNPVEILTIPQAEEWRSSLRKWLAEE